MNEPICKKCKTPISPPPNASGWLANAKLIITGFRCEHCDYWNNLKPRKPKQPKNQALPRAVGLDTKKEKDIQLPHPKG